MNYLSEKEAEERFGCLLSRDFADVKGSFVHESYREKTGDWDLHYIKGHNACKTVIAVPGISSHWTCVMKFLDPFFLEGWNICVFDYCPQVQQGTPNKKSGSSMGIKGKYLDKVNEFNFSSSRFYTKLLSPVNSPYYFKTFHIVN